MSGDANTAAGNCIIVAAMLAEFGKTYYPNKFSFLADGDDSVFFYNGPDLDDVVISNFFKRFGMTMKIEGRPNCIEEVDFCQARPVLVDGVWTMVRDYTKIFSKIGITAKTHDLNYRLKYLKALLLGELSLGRGVPLIQTYVSRYLSVVDHLMKQRNIRGVAVEAVNSNYRLSSLVPGDWMSAKTLDISSETRQSFQKAFGVSRETQIGLEGEYSKMDFDLAKSQDGGSLVDWEFPWQRPELIYYGVNTLTHQMAATS
jgi:hypothetical protein